jgi:hypothetical protein
MIGKCRYYLSNFECEIKFDAASHKHIAAEFLLKKKKKNHSCCDTFQTVKKKDLEN